MITARSERAKPIRECREKDLQSRCLAGDPAAFEEVYTVFGGVVFRYAYHLLRDREEASDVKQETFVKAFTAVRTFRGASTLQTWLLKICRNLCCDRLKSWRHRAEVPTDPHLVQNLIAQDHPESDPAIVLERAEQVAALRTALSRLPSAEYELIVLRQVEGLDPAAMAEVIGCSRSVLNVRLFRARRHLREHFEALLSEEDVK